MGLIDLKFKEGDFLNRKIADLSDTPSSDGMSAAALKAYFDYIPKTMIALGVINSIVDELTSSAGGENIGASVTGITGTTVTAIMSSLKALVDDTYNKASADLLLEAKADRATVANMVKKIEFDQSTGVFTIMEEGGTVYTFDTLLEKLAVNFDFDEEAQSLIIALDDGTIKTVDMSALITEYEFLTTKTIAATVSDGAVSFSIKPGSITDEMLSSALLATMSGYVSSCVSSAAGAAASEENAKKYANDAAGSASKTAQSETAAEGYASDSEKSASDAKYYAEQSKGSASAAETAKTQAQVAQTKAEEAAQKAQEAAGGDFLTRTEFNEKIEPYVKETDYAAKDTGGVVKVSSTFGLQINADGYLQTRLADEAALKGQSSAYLAVTPHNLSSAVKVGVTENKNELTEEEKAAAQDWLGVDELENAINTRIDTKADKAVVKTGTLTASGWTGETAPYIQTVAIEGITADTNGYAGIPDTATDEQFLASTTAILRLAGQGDGTITVKAYGTKPAVDIPIAVVVNDADISNFMEVTIMTQAEYDALTDKSGTIFVMED